MRKFALLVLAVVFGWSSGASAVLITNGLVAGYEFNGNANDVSGNGNNGVVNGATLTADRFGNANSAYSFDGTDDIIEVGAVLTDPSNLTITAWIRRQDLDIRFYQDIVAGHCGSPLFGISPGDRPEFPQQLAFGGQCNDPMVLTFEGAVIEDTLWHAVAATYDGTTVSLYRDGALVNASSQSGNFDITEQLGIGSAYGLLPTELEPFSGDIDEVFFYDRALSPAEIATLANVPEPNTALLLGIGMMGLGMRRRTRRGCG